MGKTKWLYNSIIAVSVVVCLLVAGSVVGDVQSDIVEKGSSVEVANGEEIVRIMEQIEQTYFERMVGVLIVIMLLVALLVGAMGVAYNSRQTKYIQKDTGMNTDNEAEQELEGANRALAGAVEIAVSAQAQAEHDNAVKSSFLSNMSHDIRTPLNAIIGLSQLIECQAEDADKVREYAMKLNCSGRHLLGLINDILDISKIESGNNILNITEVEVAQIKEEMDTIIRPQASAKNQHFVIKETNITSKRIAADKLRLNQILINILSNAVKYTPQGGHIEMEICQVACARKGYASYRFTISDDGQGMSEEYRKIIFEPFTREVPGVEKEIQGTGLGMAITKNLVDLMGGSISVRSHLQEGSTFEVSLDFKEVVQSQKEKEDTLAEENCDVLQGMNFLVAEDNDLNAEIIMEILSMEGARCERVTNGMEAFEKFEQSEPGSYDMILMDVQMPVMNGYDATGKIRRLGRTDAENIPIIAMTANAFAEDAQDAVKAGMTVHMAKPVDIATLRNTVRRIKQCAA